jgi:hypothetical protein
VLQNPALPVFKQDASVTTRRILVAIATNEIMGMLGCSSTVPRNGEMISRHPCLLAFLIFVLNVCIQRNAISDVTASQFLNKYPVIAAELTRLRQRQFIECSSEVHGHDDELVSTSEVTFAMSWPSILQESTFSVRSEKDFPYFRASGGDAVSCFTVMKMQPGLPFQLAFYAEEPNPPRSSIAMRPLFAATCCWENRLTDILADPQTHMTSVIEEQVGSLGNVLRVDFTRQDIDHNAVDNSVYLDPTSWVIKGARMALLAHKPGRPPAHLNSEISYQTIDGIQMPLELTYWSDSPSRPGVRFNTEHFQVTKASLEVPSSETFTVGKYGLTAPQSIRKQSGFRWFLWSNISLLVLASLYLFFRGNQKRRRTDASERH